MCVCVCMCVSVCVLVMRYQKIYQWKVTFSIIYTYTCTYKETHMCSGIEHEHNLHLALMSALSDLLIPNSVPLVTTYVTAEVVVCNTSRRVTCRDKATATLNHLSFQAWGCWECKGLADLREGDTGETNIKVKTHYLGSEHSAKTMQGIHQGLKWSFWAKPRDIFYA